MRVGILGCGHVSDQYFEGIARSDLLEIVACADLDLARAEEKGAQHRVPRACAPEELIGDPEVELVVNLTPPLAHADASLAAIAAGKHVWSEKPLAATLDRARDVVAAADSAAVRLGCAPDTFLGGSIQTAIKLLDEGWIGAPVSGVGPTNARRGPGARVRRRSSWRRSSTSGCAAASRPASLATGSA